MFMVILEVICSTLL